MSISMSISSNPNINSKTYGINSNTTFNSSSLNVKSGLTITRTDDGPFKGVSASLNAAKFTADYNIGESKHSTSISSASASVKSTAVVGFGGGAEVKASLAEVAHKSSFKIWGAEISANLKVGIGVAIGGKAGISNNSVSLGVTGEALPGVYVGVGIDVKL
ncbi:hypothetical protein Y919_11195 [Caloranaerobacter azorensis H53214]|uniref:Uncharacterized protein n=1 Tax=Caloranaerobacter azorensis H53214 TaxID=1156417 RepID=A0A096BEL4_9FIRM|nr:hypothetical protein [Caloranaerobacter azorensis]KGG79580.1 hypothetical protein Y919_11195 [Caloranaerobacter azorensis H53214]